MNKHYIFLLTIVVTFFLSSCDQNQWKLTSPENSVQSSISLQEGQLSLSLNYNGKTILDSSPVGLQVDGVDFTRIVQVSDFSERAFDETWEIINGKNQVVRNHYHEYNLKIARDEKAYDLVMRLYDDGFAYRYIFQEGATIDAEMTSLNFSSDFTVWAYNGEKHNVGPTKRSANEVNEFRFPIVMKLESGTFAAIHEAEILEFAPFSVNAAGPGNSMRFNIDYSPREKAFKTSWRVIMLGERIGDLVESDLLVNLNEPCKIEETSWIKPGKSLWDWRVWGYSAPDGFEYGLNTDSHKRMIDFAAENNIQNLLIDADWYGAEFSEESDPTSGREGIVIEECMAHAKEKGVGVILYLNDVGAKKFGLEKVLKQFHDWGAVGVKYGFMRGTPEEKVKHTRNVVELCAKYELMVDFHDNPIPPSGDRRTWPNLVTREFGHAQADAKYSHLPETSVNQVLINQISGPLDFTNGWFDLNNSFGPRTKVFEVIPGTVAAEVAKLITIYTGWMVLPDAPEAYLKYDDLFDCIRQMPPQFDSFKILDAKLDEYVIVARKSGGEWFVGSLTNTASRALDIKLDFLEQGKSYTATLYEDAENAHFESNKEAYKVRNLDVSSKSIISAKLAAGGGHSMWIR